MEALPLGDFSPPMQNGKHFLANTLHWKYFILQTTQKFVTFLVPYKKNHKRNF